MEKIIEKPKSLWTRALFGVFIFVLFLFFAIYFTPNFVADNFSPDGILKQTTIFEINLFRLGFSILSTMGLLFSVLYIIKPELFYLIQLKFSKIPVSSDLSLIYLILFGILLTITAIPICIVKIPAMGDYLNHLSRMHIIASVDSDPFLARYYEIKWNLIPNIGMDLVVPLLSRFFDIYLAGKIFVLIVLVLITSGVFAIHFAVYKQFSLAPFVALLFVYNTV